MRLDFVVPRYGMEVVGGAEYGARMLAERLVELRGWDVEVLTTCAISSDTWADEYEPGTTEINGVTVRRFRSAAGRDPGFDKWSDRVLVDPRRAAPRDQERWIDLQGPVNPDVIEAARRSDAGAIVFYPYLFHPTVHGVPALGRRAVLQAAAHDEAPLRLPLFRRVFAGAAGLVFHTFGEQELVQRLFPVAATRQIVLGLGVEDGPGEAAPARAALGLGDRPYVACVGRVDDGKGTRMLVELFAAYKQRRPGPLALVLVGPVIDEPPRHPDVIVAGAVDDETKWGAIRGAQLLVSPSAYESFSIVLIEAWTVGVPVVVNARCAATREHCERSGGGLWFDGYAELEVTLDRLLGDEALRRGLAARGRAYVDATFRWPVLIERYATFLEGVAARA
jgi:glycosyltransferase involved in cell wall biosynthesis